MPDRSNNNRRKKNQRPRPPRTASGGGGGGGGGGNAGVVGNERERQFRLIQDRIHAEQEALAALSREKAAASIGGLAKPKK